MAKPKIEYIKIYPIDNGVLLEFTSITKDDQGDDVYQTYKMYHVSLNKALDYLQFFCAE